MAKILLVEDDALLRELYLETLSDAGYSVETSVDGEDAYQKIKSNTWDLVLLDIILPKMNGLDIMRKIKQEDSTSKRKVVFLTNLDNSTEIKEALNLGLGYLIKSQLTPGDILSEVKMFLEK